MFNFFSKFLESKFSGYLAIAGVVVVLGLVFYIYNEGKQACENKIVNQQVETLEKRNEIANQRPDAGAVVKRLRSGTF